MLETLPAWIYDGITPWTLVVILVLLLFTGRLHTNISYQSVEKEKEYWRDTAMTQQKTNQIQAEALAKQEITNDMMVKVLHGLQELHQNHHIKDGG